MDRELQPRPLVVLGLNVWMGTAAGPYRDGPASGLYCGSRLRKGEVFAYVGLSQNLKDLKVENRSHSCRSADPLLGGIAQYFKST